MDVLKLFWLGVFTSACNMYFSFCTTESNTAAESAELEDWLDSVLDD